MIAMDTVVVAADQQASVDLDGRTVLLNLPSGNYYQLDDVGARVWELLRVPTTGEEICRKLVAEYDVDAGDAARDVLGFLEDLASEGLVTPADTGDGA